MKYDPQIKEPKLTYKENILCAYASSVMLVAGAYLEAGEIKKASVYLKEEADNLNDEEVMRRIAWIYCRKG